MLTRFLKMAVFFIGGFALIASCSLGEIQGEKEDATDTTAAGAQVTRASGDMLKLVLSSIHWGVSERTNPRRVYFETRDANPGCAVYCPPNFYPLSYYAQPYPGHYRFYPGFTGKMRWDSTIGDYWYRFYLDIRMDHQPSYMHPNYITNISIYYYDENDEPYENEYLQIIVC